MYRDYRDLLDFMSIGNKSKGFVFKSIPFNHGVIETKDVPELFECDEFVFREIVQAFLDYAKEQKIESKSESYCEGKLSAIEKHLEDMRTLVFKPLTLTGDNVVNK